MLSKYKIHFILAGIVIVLTVVGVSWWRYYTQKTSLTSVNVPPSTATNASSSASPTMPDNTSKLETYRNTEFGFEFQYPSDWILEDDKSYSPFSKFTRIGAPLEKKYLIYYPSPPFVVNIVTPNFVDNQFSDLKNIASGIVVGGVSGLRYEYKDEESHITIILPLGQYKMILGATKGYDNVLDQILASFKFL